MTTRTTCRGCGSTSLAAVLSLGETPLANGLLDANELALPEETFPLDVIFCRQCALVQITKDVPPAKLFSEYLYLSSYSDTMVAHARELARRLILEETLDAGSLVVEIASNDGYLLQNYVERAIPVLGVEPAANIARIAEGRKIPTVVNFFTSSLATSLDRRADVVHAHNVLAHVPDPVDVLAGIAALLTDGGVAVIEVPYLRELVERCEFDTIYHEHLCYFSLTALVFLARRAGLEIHDVEQVAIHGGSLRLFLSRPGSRPRKSEVESLASMERGLGMRSERYYSDFASRVVALRDELVGTLARLKSEGASIAAYGAAAKGATLLNYAGITAETISFVVDRSPHKQGKLIPGARIPILEPDELLRRQPDYCLLLPWNFESEILEQQSAYRAAGGKFIVPVPALRIV